MMRGFLLAFSFSNRGVYFSVYQKYELSLDLGVKNEEKRKEEEGKREGREKQIRGKRSFACSQKNLKGTFKLTF